jgi:hypothetical protein
MIGEVRRGCTRPTRSLRKKKKGVAVATPLKGAGRCRWLSGPRAAATTARADFGWSPRFTDIREIVDHAWNWELKQARRVAAPPHDLAHATSA